MKTAFMRLIFVMCVALALIATFGSGSAFARDEYKGMTYEKAVSYISQYGKAVITSRVGEYLPTEKCLVTGSRTGHFLDSSGRGKGATILLDLNCGAPLAEPGHPGASQMTPEGKKIAVLRNKAKIISDQYARAVAAGDMSQSYCASGDTARSACKNLCNQAGTCSAELLEFLG